MRIFKYQLPAEFEFELKMPKSAEVLCVQMQGNTPCIWARVVGDTTDLETRTFVIVGTGNEFDDEGYFYIGTFQESNYNLVWHLFELWDLNPPIE
jgi:hypothetical protein